MFNTDKVGLAMSICIVLASDHICYHTYYAKTKFDLKVKGQGRIQGGGGGGGGGGGLWGLKPPPPFIFRLYLINMLSIIMKFCLSIII